MNIRELLAKGAKKLNNPDEAQLLLSYVLHTPKLLLAMEPNRSITPEQSEEYERVIARRSAHEPVAYITGQKEFFGLTFHVEPGVLIPRPETEYLVERAVALLKERDAQQTPTSVKQIAILDIGTGSGAIACAVAANIPITLSQITSVLAIEFSKIAFTIAKQNIAALNLTQKVELLPGNGIVPALEKRAFKQAQTIIIVANLPYIPTNDYLALMPDVKNYEPREALDGGKDGLDMYRVLLNQLQEYANSPEGKEKTIVFLAEIDPSQSATLPQEIKNRFPRAETHTTTDLNNATRFVEARIN